MTSSPDTPRGTRPAVEVRRMDQYDHDVRDEVMAVIVDGYLPQLSLFSKDRHKLNSAFRDGIRADMFYVAELDSRIVGVLACSDNTGRALVPDKAPLRRGLGLVVGSIAAHLIKDLGSTLPYDDGTGYVEWVATRSDARGKGAATALIEHVAQRSRYRTLVLEVTDTNVGARRLYAAHGFVEYERKSAKGLERRSFKERVYMRRELR